MSWAEKVFSSLTLEEKVGQVIINRGLNYPESMEELLKEGKLGGVGAVVLRKVCRNNPRGLVDYVNKIIEISKIPPFLYIDAEQGVSDMFGKVGTTFPNQMAIAATHNPQMAYDAAYAISSEANMLGFNISCNPVLDVNSNPNNPIIGVRAFGDNVDFVIDFGRQYVKGMQDAKIIPTGKHFPGHGDTSTDSHISMPVVDHPREYLDNVELKPFRVLMAEGMKGIMTAHIYFPALQEGEEPGTPATLSRKIMTGLVKEEWKYEGLVITDSLTMKAIKDRFGIGKAAVLALKAGNDMILQDYDSDPKITFEALLEAVKSGEIDMEQLDNSVMKILKFKEWCGVHTRQKITYEIAEMLTSMTKNIETSKKIAESSVTVVENGKLPLSGSAGGKKVLVVATTSDPGLSEAKDMAVLLTEKYYYFYNSIKRHAPDAKLFTVYENPTKEQIEKLSEISGNYDEIIFITFVRILSYKEGSGTVPQSQVDLLNMLNGSGRSISTVVAGNPYVIDKLPKTDNILCTYCECIYSLDAAADILFGKLSPKGKLPVSINEKYKFGHGLC
jgi:beta-N-acetylhexosaminidase